MWKNVTINFLVLSLIVFSGEYIHYQINLQNTPELKTPVKVEQVRSGISGAFYNSSHRVVISGAVHTINTQPFHICGIERSGSNIIITISPADTSGQSTLLSTTTS